MAGIVDEFSTKVLVDWFKREEPAIDYLFLQITEIFTKHKNTVKMGEGTRACHPEKERVDLES